jgi:FixJ family two-component response regulator
VTNPKPVVAIVDDDLRMLESLQDLLESSGYAARPYASAAALLSAGLAGIDVLIADIDMPGMDGFELGDVSRRLRPELPVFLITGRHELMDDERVRRADRLFRKPFDATSLLWAVEAALRSRNDGGPK